MTSRIGRKDTKIIWSDERKIEKKLYFVLKFVDFCSFYIAITIIRQSFVVFGDKVTHSFSDFDYFPIPFFIYYFVEMRSKWG